MPARGWSNRFGRALCESSVRVEALSPSQVKHYGATGGPDIQDVCVVVNRSQPECSPTGVIARDTESMYKVAQAFAVAGDKQAALSRPEPHHPRRVRPLRVLCHGPTSVQPLGCPGISEVEGSCSASTGCIQVAFVLIKAWLLAWQGVDNLPFRAQAFA